MPGKFTGERFIPSLRGQIYYEHMHRYAVAARACDGKRVLDLACGEGFGSAFLARRAASVVGIDADEPTIVDARRSYYNTNLEFVASDACNLPLVDGSIDVVTSFETIEHLEDHEGLLDEIRRVLAPGGVLFMSSPNKLVYSDKSGARNPFHVSELYFEEFRDLLRRHFPNVAIYGQRLVTSSVLHPLGGEHDEEAGWISGDVRRTESGLGALQDPVYFVAVCSYGPLPDYLAGGFIDPASDLETLQSEVEVDAAENCTRILLACAPKSGSTYVTNVLSRYFDVEIASNTLEEIQWEAEQNLTRGFLKQFSAGYVLQLHMKPYPMFFALMREYGVKLLLQWRNLGDGILSLDEHLAEYGVDQPLCYIHDGPGFLSLPDHMRYDYLIKNAVQWYLWFYLAWRRRDVVLGSYERMVADPVAFFSETIGRFAAEIDLDRLTSILAAPEGFVRHNVGKVGRSAERFSDENKRLLERTILSNPWSSDLEVLLWELPWDVPDLKPLSPYDGKVVGLAGDAIRYFVSRGMRHHLTKPDSWMASRHALRESTRISKAKLAALREGAPIS